MSVEVKLLFETNQEAFHLSQSLRKYPENLDFFGFVEMPIKTSPGSLRQIKVYMQ